MDKLKNSTDLRVQKSVRDIKQALLSLIAVKPYRKIHVDDITHEALISRHTFYRHFDSIDDALSAIGKDMLKALEAQLSELAPDDLSGALNTLYEYLDTDDVALHKLFFDEEYADFFHHLTTGFFRLDFFQIFYRRAAYPDIMPGYFGSAVPIFLNWKKSPAASRPPLTELAKTVAGLLLNGIQ